MYRWDMQRILVAIALASGLVGCGNDKSQGERDHGEPKHSQHDLAAVAVKRFAYELYPMWASANSAKACPDTIEELNQYLNPKYPKQTKDPWGTPYKMPCGPTAPEAARGGVASVSAGPDMKLGTDDDIASFD